jgi:CRISPR-associated protein Csb1
MSITQFDYLLAPDGPVALAIQEPLQPVQGADTPVFPPTFAPPEGDREKKPAYVIDSLPGGSVALIDTVGAQANRIEPLFKRPEYSSLVPQIEVRVGERRMHLLEAGHRAADAVVRFSNAGDRFQTAFVAYRQSGDSTPLAKLAPTSIVFGVWDSRDTQVKLPRLVESTVRAFNIDQLSRSAQFFSSLEKEELNQLNLDQKVLSEEGLNDAPAGRVLGGIIARGGIRRDATLNLIALRALASSDSESTRALQRYILGLALIAFTAPTELYLRQGCLLVADPKNPAKLESVKRTGTREEFSATGEQILSFAHSAAQAFRVGEAFEAQFTPEKVKKANDAKKAAKKPKEPKDRSGETTHA